MGIFNYIRTTVYLPKFIPHSRNYIHNKTAGTKDGLEENTVTDGQLQHPHTEDESLSTELLCQSRLYIQIKVKIEISGFAPPESTHEVLNHVTKCPHCALSS